jgi:hypothetical protein
MAIDEPLSVRVGKPMLYRVADSNLRFYLAIGRTAQEWSRRGRPAPAKALLRQRWASWHERAVEPVIREALSLSAADLPWPEAIAVGGWWNRAFQPEIDLVGADRAPVAREIYYVGSVKWLDRPFDDHDFAALQRDAIAVPGFDPGRTHLTAVSRAGAANGVSRQLALCWGPQDVVAAFSASGASARSGLLGQSRGQARAAASGQWTHSPSACCPLVRGGGPGYEGGDRSGLGQVDDVAARGFGHRRVGAFGHGPLGGRGIIRSSVATRYRLGLIRQAASVIVPPSAFTPQGTWESAMNAACRRAGHPRRRQGTSPRAGSAMKRRARLAVCSSPKDVMSSRRPPGERRRRR